MTKGLNPPPPPGTTEVRVIDRVLASPRIDPGTPDARHVVIHWRSMLESFTDPEDPQTQALDDYRESIRVWSQSSPGSWQSSGGVTEGDPALDALGGQLMFGGQPLVFGGAAYRWNSLLAWPNQEIFLTPRIGQGSTGELNTFGGLTINGGTETGARYAFFASVITETQDENDVDRTVPPTESTHKPNPVYRGVWSALAPGDTPRLRARVGSQAPADLNPIRSFQVRNFQRLDASDYIDSPWSGGSRFAEQRFGRTTNIAMNNQGAVAFRGDIALQFEPPIFGIWADYVDAFGVHTLHRVFVEDAPPPGQSNGGDPWIEFDHNASSDPADLYMIHRLGPPAISNHPTQPVVAAYAVVQGGDLEGGASPTRRPDPVTAIITRRPGTDVNNQTGFVPRIVAIEGEPFRVRSDPNTYTLRISPGRNSGHESLPGLEDVGRGMWKQWAGTNERMNATMHHPRPAINAKNHVVFVGAIETIKNAENQLIGPGVEPLSGRLREEAIFSTRWALAGAHMEMVVREGDPAPVIVDGVALLGARFVDAGYDAISGFSALLNVDDVQAFHRPIINDKDEIVFVGTWYHPTTDTFGRSIFRSRYPGHLECMASSGDIIRQQLNVPDSTQPVNVKLSHEFGKAPNPSIIGTFANSFDQVMYSECGILAFTTRLQRQDTGASVGWGLFLQNTKEVIPGGIGAQPRGPQLVVKTGTGDFEDDTFEVDGVPDDVFVRGSDVFHTGIALGYGEPSGGDVALHNDGTIVFAVNPDWGQGPIGGNRGLVVVSRPTLESMDYDGDGVIDGCDNCPATFNPGQEDNNQDGVGDVCTGGGGGECTNCMLCTTIDCEFFGMMLGLGPDYNGDGFVDDTDLTLMMWAQGLPGGRFDMNKDGIVDGKDIAILLESWGKYEKPEEKEEEKKE